MSNKIGVAPHHIPKVAAGGYKIIARLNQKKDTSTVLNEGIEQHINFQVAGYNASIPQNEVLAVYPPIEHTGNFAGTFPHIQFKRSTLPWEYKVDTSTENEDRLPYIFLVLLNEEELKKITIIDTDTNQLADSTESPDEPKPLKILAFNNSDLFPKANLIHKLAHVRVQEHTELKDLNLPKETSILVSHRMVEPNTKYKAFVCYYACKIEDEVDKGKYKMITDLTDNSALEYVVILNEWSFDSIGAELYQIDFNKLKNHPLYKSFNDNLKDSEIGTLEEIKKHTNSILRSLIEENESYQKKRDENWVAWNDKDNISGFDKQEEKEKGNNYILEYLQYNGKNLKGYFHELELQPFKTFLKKKISDERSEDYPSHIKSLLDISKVPLEHQLKAGGKMVSWYQGPFTNNTSKFNLLQLLADQKIETIPDHQDYLNLFNKDTGMYDMTYSTAWQLGRLMIMNDNKVLQELKKWKYDLELYNLVVEQNKLSHLPNLCIQEPSIPDVLMNYVTELIQFRNFPLYYLLPHADLSTEESIKHFKIDNSWILAFLFGIFSAGPKLKISDFTKYLYRKEIFDRIDNKKIKTKLDEFLSNLAKGQSIEEFKNNIIQDCKSIIESNSEKETTFYNRVIEILNRIKYEMWYVFNPNTDYYGILLQSQTIKNWPHLVVKLNQSHEFHYLTSINDSLRLYITDKKVSNIELYLKNEDAHFGINLKDEGNDHLILENNYTIKDLKEINSSVDLANKLLYKQPNIVFNFI